MNPGLITLYVLSFMELLASAHLHGKPRDNWNFVVEVINTIVLLSLVWWITGWKFI